MLGYIHIFVRLNRFKFEGERFELKKISTTKFVIGDEKGTCMMKIDPNFSGSDVLAENHCYQIHYDKSNIEENTLVLRKNVRILESSWKVRVPVQIIAKANISHDVEKVSSYSLSLENTSLIHL